jgi:aminoglycoside 6'-N-acetyltransferase I
MFFALWPDGAPEDHRAEAAAILAGAPVGTTPLVLFVAEVDGEVVGFVEVDLRSHADGCDPTQPVAFLEGWYVDPEHRQSGIGGALLAAAEEWGRAQGCREIGSDTWIDEEVSVKAHVALGYEIVDRCVHFKKTL